jgi:hypothetical protein
MVDTTSGLAVCGLLEQDPSGARLSWVFPAAGELEAGVIAARAQLGAPLGATPTFVWTRWKGLWYYTLSRARKPAEEADVVHAAVTRFGICLGSHLFDPERHEALLRVLLRAFEAEGGSPLALLQRVLSVSISGTAEAPPANGGAGATVEPFVAKRFDAAAARLACPLSATLQSLGPEGVATVWSAMVLRARVCVYHAGGVAPLLSLVRCLPLLAWHRSRWEAPVRGLCSLCEGDVAELRSAGGLAAGFVEGSVVEHHELYDVLIEARPAAAAGAPAVLTLRLSPSWGVPPPPAALVKLLSKAVEGAAGGGAAGGTSEVVEALYAKTSELLEKAAEVATTADDDACGLPDGVAPFLRRLHAAEALGA